MLPPQATMAAPAVKLLGLVFLNLSFIVTAVRDADESHEVTSQGYDDTCKESDMRYDFEFTDCQDAYKQGWTTSGIYRLSINGTDGIVNMNVYCDQEIDGGGWTVFQRRMDGSVDFFRTWLEYKHGFGNLNSEFWLGNDNIHALTTQGDHMLKVEMALTAGGKKYYANYTKFAIRNEAQRYKLILSGFIGDIPPGDSLTYSRGHKFSTWDMDNDRLPSASCACTYHGAWWYDRCHLSNLNGLYGSTVRGVGLNWSTLTRTIGTVAETRLLIKRSPDIGHIASTHI